MEIETEDVRFKWVFSFFLSQHFICFYVFAFFSNLLMIVKRVQFIWELSFSNWYGKKLLWQLFAIHFFFYFRRLVYSLNDYASKSSSLNLNEIWLRAQISKIEMRKIEISNVMCVITKTTAKKRWIHVYIWGKTVARTWINLLIEILFTTF